MPAIRAASRWCRLMLALSLSLQGPFSGVLWSSFPYCDVDVVALTKSVNGRFAWDNEFLQAGNYLWFRFPLLLSSTVQNYVSFSGMLILDPAFWNLDADSRSGCPHTTCRHFCCCNYTLQVHLLDALVTDTLRLEYARQFYPEIQTINWNGLHFCILENKLNAHCSATYYMCVCCREKYIHCRLSLLVVYVADSRAGYPGFELCEVAGCFCSTIIHKSMLMFSMDLVR